MNGLFKASKKEPVGAGVFKFSFKLGGDEDLEESAPSKKKNKNKKKKKKPTASVELNGSEITNGDDKDESVESNDAGCVTNGVDGVIDALSHAHISNNQSNPAETAPTEDKPLSKSQKKNLQKKNAKKAVEALPGLTGASQEVSIPPGSKTPLQSKIDRQPKNAAKAFKSDTAPIVSVSDDEFAVPEPKTPKNKKSKAQPKAKPKVVHEPKAAGLAFAHLAAPEPQKGPHFISSKDPELDEATKLRFKYGMGRNLVAIGPTKVRDPNWLPPPPGLTRSTPLAGVFGGGSNGNGVSKVNSPVKTTPAKIGAADAAAADEVHSSPFSFSFNGL